MSKEIKIEIDNRSKKEKKADKEAREQDLIKRVAEEMFRKWKEKYRDNGMHLD